MSAATGVRKYLADAKNNTIIAGKTVSNSKGNNVSSYIGKTFLRDNAVAVTSVLGHFPNNGNEIG